MSGAQRDQQGTLQQQQNWMLAAISAATQVQCWADADRYLQSSADLDAASRLGIYQRSYWTRLLQSFHVIFPGLLHTLGTALLDAFVLAFLEHHRPRHYSINRVADGFVEYLEHTRPQAMAAADWPDFIVDLARLETALLRVSEAQGLEHAAPRPNLVCQSSDEQLAQSRPQATPCLQLLQCRYAVHDHLDAARAGDRRSLPEPRPTCLALTRVHYRLSTRELAPVQWHLLQRLDGSITLRAALESVADLALRPAPSMELARVWLSNFVSQGLLHGCHHLPMVEEP